MVEDDEFAERHNDADDIEGVLAELIDIVNNAKSMPLSSSVLVTRDELLGLLEKARNLLPAEIQQARWMMKERDDLLSQAQKDADDIIQEGRTRVEQMVQRSEVMRQARREADRLIGQAHAQSRKLLHEVEDFCDKKLAGFEISLDRIVRVVRQGRQKLQATSVPVSDSQDIDQAGAGSSQGAKTRAEGAHSSREADDVFLDDDPLFDQDET
ncbi:MAG: hypothetical protein M1483_01080 [Actinobacteria bacterium]|nr:hypothetical protein [Actinomycetota bacterium]MCL6104228.1 hypothetical protein [Actinomycetota bacterium]